eukprot:Plantae.Rhodophyta-Purpureofilum_apyrenoidigerum.ctg7454.p1 GENE.Plantae.Rhodophyta-Purpureofilum_apyrenoidigerum.ctg7454~~Plantae.Rhodophyta-Purpureofilum_apyrenoidigerum.ctg7454.p1  ORF type:complete len:217 (+),score=26.23 Plantae.Rhodophyta-Purpureofilum_apyrenoidigerum.ctg7454:333-983(+)
MAASAVDTLPRSASASFTSFVRRNKTVTILDWDDTILASSFLQTVGDRGDLGDFVMANMSELETHALGLLEEALKVGTVIIVTNAESGWVEISAATYMPRVLHCLRSNNVRIVSARSIYESQYQDNPLQWKLCAFICELSVVFHGSPADHVIVLGDGVGECFAARGVQNMLPSARVKTIKFVNFPTVKKLIEQQDVIKSHLKYVASLDRSFEVRLT